jgi:hypothetical protein
MSIFGGGSTTTTSQAPWTSAQPYLQNIMKSAQGMVKNKTGFNAPPTSDLFSPYSDQTQGALSGIQATASQGNPLAGQSIGAISGILSGTPGGNNPNFEAALQNQTNLLGNDIQRQFSGLGRLGSAADTGALAQQIGAVRTGALSQQYNQDVQNRLQAVQAAPGAYAQQFLPYQYQAQVGAAYDQQNQARNAAHLTQFNAAQQAPWNRLNAQSALSGGGSLNTASSTQVPSNPFGAALGGALSGLPYGPYGALAGGVGGFLSHL